MVEIRATHCTSRQLHDKILQAAWTGTSFEQVATDCMHATAVKFQRARELYYTCALEMGIAVRDKRVRMIGPALTLPQVMGAQVMTDAPHKDGCKEDEQAANQAEQTDPNTVVKGELSPGDYTPEGATPCTPEDREMASSLGLPAEPTTSPTPSE